MKKLFTLSLLLLFYFSDAFGQACPNSDFSLMNFNFWQGFTGVNNGGGLGCCPTAGIVPGRQTLITQTTVDTNTCGGLTVPPPGMSVCARLGNALAGSQAERLVYTFTVNAANPVFIFSYAIVQELSLDEKPVSPYFSFRLFNAANQIIDAQCGEYEHYAASISPGFHQCASMFHMVSWKDWTRVGIDLTPYIGQTLHIQFTTRDCSANAHFGYAYVTAECTSMTIDQSYCMGTNNVVLTAPYGFVYQWSTGDTTQSINIVNPPFGATYTCNVTSLPGCVFHLSSTITNTIMHPSFISSHDTCSRTVMFNGTSSINTGNAYSSHWDFGDGATATTHDPIHTFPGTGTYNVTLNISTIGGCDSSVTHPVTIGLVPIASFTAHDTCEGMSVVFHNTSHAPDGIVSWHWNFGDGSPPNTTTWNPTHLYPSPGSYTVKLFATNTRGCVDSITHVVIIYAIPVANFSNTIPVCSGQNATITFTGNSTPLTVYNWNFNGGTVVSGSGAGPYVVNWSNSGPQTVNLTITDAMCNSSSDTVRTVNVNLTPVANAGPDTSLCLGNAVVLGATGGNTYLWSPGTGLSNTHIWNPTAHPTSTTTYHLTVTMNGCSSTDQIVVSVFQLAPVSVTNDTMICNGEKILLHATGGTHYLWSPALGLSANNIPDPLATLTQTTTYTVTISDNFGCQAIEHVTVQLSGAISSAFQVTVDTMCVGSNTNIYFNGGSYNPFATYTWDFDGGIVVLGTGNGPYVIHWNNPGLYHVSLTVSEATCDSSYTTHSILIIPGPIVEAGQNDTICAGETIPLLASGGVAYAWWPALGLNNPGIANPLATPLTTTMYHVWVINGTCYGQDSLQVFVKPSPIVNAGNDTTICVGDSVQLTATGGVSYLWSPQSGLSSANIANPIATPSSTTTYTVTATAQNACTATDQVIVNVVSKPTSTFVADHNKICLEDSIQLTYTGNSSSNANYVWNFNGASIASGSGSGPYSLYWPAAGNYTLSLIVHEGSCISIQNSLQVSVNKVDAAISAFHNISCFGDTNGMATVGANGGTLPYSYSWSNSQTLPIIDHLIPGIYTVTVSDSVGCKDTVSIEITGPTAKLSLVSSPENISCSNLCDGKITTLVSGGTPPYNYMWNTQPVQNTPVASNLCPGNYLVTITDNNGCDTIDQLTLIANTNILASCVADSLTGLVPLNVEFTFTGTGANSFLWNFGDNTSSVLVNPSHTYTSYGVYQVILIINSLNPDFCTDTARLIIHAEDTSYVNLPNVFTPNQDGFNDYFDMKSHFLENCTFTIFNRWGTVVYESTDEVVHWDGKTHTGNPAPEGTYFYTLKATGKDGHEFKQSGALTLLR